MKHTCIKLRLYGVSNFSKSSTLGWHNEGVVDMSTCSTLRLQKSHGHGRRRRQERDHLFK